jgi:hypothetical protein
VTFLPVDSTGNFRIERDFAGLPLPVGVYQVEAFATDYDFARSNSFAVRDGENADIGVVVLSRPPLQLSDMQPCANIPAAGGKCRYSVTITNRTAETIKGQVWSLVNAFAIGSRFGSTMFQTDEAKKIRIAPAASKVVYFTFKVPEKVTAGTSICADLWIGKSPRAFFDTLAQLPLFCIQKEFSGAFRIMPQTGAPDMTEPSRRQSPQAASLAERKEQLLRQLRNKTR